MTEQRTMTIKEALAPFEASIRRQADASRQLWTEKQLERRLFAVYMNIDTKVAVRDLLNLADAIAAG